MPSVHAADPLVGGRVLPSPRRTMIHATPDAPNDAPNAANTPGTRPLDDPETLREMAHLLREGVYVAEADGRVLDANAAFLEMTGAATIAELSARRLDDLVTDPARRRAALAGLAETGGARELEVQLLRPDGSTRTVLETVWARGAQGATRLHGILADVSEARTLEARLRDAVARDPLTGAFDRRHLDTVAREVEHDARAGWGCLHVNVRDGVAAVSARRGRPAADEALQRMGRFLMRSVRADEPVIRLDDDAFLVVLKGATGDRTERVARRLQLQALRTAPVPFHLGWAAREGGERLEELVSRASARGVPVLVVERERDDRMG